MTANESAGHPSENRIALFFTHVWGVIRRPRSTIETLVERRPIWEAVIIMLTSAVLSGISRGLLTSDAVIEAFELDFGLLMRLALLGVNVLIGLLTYAVPLSILAGCYWLMIRILGGDASYLVLLTMAAFLTMVFVISGITRFAFFIISQVFNTSSAVETLLEISGNNVIAVVLVIWYIVLNVLLVRYASGMSTVRAIVAVVIPLVLIATGIMGGFIGMGLNVLSRLG